MIIMIFLIGFTLGLAYSLIAEKLPLLIPDIPEVTPNSWILNLFIGILNSVALLISYYYFDFSYEFFASVIVSALVIIIFVTDFKYLIILDSPLVISSLIILSLKAYYFDLKTMGLSILSGLFLMAFMFIVGLIGKKIFKREALGGGDIKLSFVIGTILGLRLGLISIIFSSLLALPYALASIMLSKNKEVPFGPFLVGSMALVFIFSDKFMSLINLLT